MKVFKKVKNKKYSVIQNKLALSNIDNKNPLYLKIEDLYFSGLIIVDYPRNITSEFMEKLIYLDINFDICMYFEKLNTYDVIRKLTYNIGNLNTDMIMNSKSKQDYDILDITYDDAKNIRKELQINNESIYNFYMYLNFYANSEKELKQKILKIQSLLYGYGIISKLTYFKNLYLFKSILPFNNNQKEIKYNSKRSIISKSLSCFYPFISSNICEYKGILYGYNIYNKSVVIIDRFNKEKYINSNICVFGASGSGKSYFTKLQILRNSLLNTYQFVLDPEGEYRSICEEISGEYIKIGNKSKTYINIFDIYESKDLNEYSLLEEKLQQLNIFFNIALPKITDKQRNYLEEKIIELYKSKEITFDNNSLYKLKNNENILIKPKFKEYKDMPIFSELYEIIKNDNDKLNILSLIKPFVSGSLKVFNNYTNINKDAKNIFIDISDINNKYIDIYLFSIIDFFWSVIKQKNMNNKIIYIDEIWKLINLDKNSLCANFVVQIFKTIRKYNGSAFAITQDISDLLINKELYANTIINNSCFKCIFKMNEENIQNLKSLIYLSEQEIYRINNLSRGECLLIADNDDLIINISSCDYEKNIIENNEKN